MVPLKMEVHCKSACLALEKLMLRPEAMEWHHRSLDAVPDGIIYRIMIIHSLSIVSRRTLFFTKLHDALVESCGRDCLKNCREILNDE
jgi:hypothetical protein